MENSKELIFNSDCSFLKPVFAGFILLVKTYEGLPIVPSIDGSYVTSQGYVTSVRSRDTNGNVISISADTINISGNASTDTEIHELGHVLGFGHQNNSTKGIMSYADDPSGFQPDQIKEFVNAYE